MIFSKFHLDKSGNETNDKQPENIKLKLLTFLVFHFDISGKNNIDVHPENI